MPAEQGDVRRQAEHEQGRQDAHVEAVEPGERSGCRIRPADDDLLEVRADDRRPPHDVGGDLRRPVALLVPGKQVAGQAEAQRHEQQGHAEPPVDLAGRAVGAGEQDLEQVQGQQDDHRLRAEVVDAPDEPAERSSRG